MRFKTVDESKEVNPIRAEHIGILVGANIISLLKFYDHSEKIKGSYINYKQLIHSTITKNDDPKKQELAQIAYDSVIELFDVAKGKQIELTVAIETLSYSFENEMKSFYGNEYFNLLDRFLKKQHFKTSNATTKESYEVADVLRDIIRRKYFERMK